MTGPRWAVPALAVAFLAALFLRLWQVEQQVPIDDEWHAISMLATAGYARIATTFGLVDHSIPLTLLYKAIAEAGLLSEDTLLAVPLTFGIATWVALVAGANWSMSAGERITFAALLAVSPLLVLYSREARPYALTLCLTLCSLASAIAWWRYRRAWQAVLYIVAAAVAVYAHLIVAPSVFGVWIALMFEGVRERRGPADLFLASTPGIAAGLLVALLVAPPLVADWGVLRLKAGADRLTLESAFRAAGMLLGTGLPALMAALAALAASGARVSLGRHPLATRVLLVVLAMQFCAVVASGALWISWPMVLARYLLLFTPIAAYGIALGLGAIGRLMFGNREAPVALAGVALAALLYVTGPLPALLHAPNAFFAHHAYWSDFDRARSRVLQDIAEGPIPAFYRELAGGRGAGEVTLIEAPWRFESMFNRQPIFVEIHRQRVRIGLLGGVCPPGSYAEHPRHFPNRFRNIVDLAAGDEVIRASGDYLVVHGRLELSNMTESWQTWNGRGLPAVDACLPVFTRRFGAPVFQDDTITVFALRPGPQ